MTEDAKIGPTCRERITQFYQQHRSWQSAAEALGINHYTLYRAWRGDKGVGLKTAQKLQRGLNLSTTDEIFS